MATIAARSVGARSTRRFFSSASSGSSCRNNYQQTHNFLEPNSYIGSWEAPSNLKVAQAKLALLRKDYARQVKESQKDYMVETESLRLEKQWKGEARIEAIRAANEERKKLTTEAAQVKAQNRRKGVSPSSIERELRSLNSRGEEKQ